MDAKAKRRPLNDSDYKLRDKSKENGKNTIDLTPAPKEVEVEVVTKETKPATKPKAKPATKTPEAPDADVDAEGAK